ncbi:EAL domain, c-di-GMP-specific phosphodiesterase class I (or its enzymatically inactive variant) [Cupriavidus sp. YR651]|uniref:EAL domain-containing protein n=1 Tax=Cupriavidus sp. YR651 TaxID=1855315 RepID=UPI00088F02C2|nr:EAL domain-containing protein [Cupriavidus sp. YR651]SDC04751.1 EAL domain, c-di-GMP-specific phosphodiesterase class I (or its enzymatically inactive variant) [Cupriavidus sp. YR651]
MTTSTSHHAPARTATSLATSAALERYLESLPREPVPGRELWRDAHGQVQGQYFNCSLTSAFEPLVTLAEREVVAYEGTIRTYAEDGVGLAAWKLFAMAADDASLVSLDRLSRLVHAINYFSAAGTHKLVLNVHNRLLAAVADDHGAAFRRALESLGLPIDRFVIQVPASANDDLPLLLHVVGNYRRNGFAVSLQASDPAEAGALMAHALPDWLKLDMRRTWTDRQLAGLRASAEGAGVTLIGRRLQDDVAVERLQNAGIVLGQGVGVAGGPVPARHLHAYAPATTPREPA